MGESASRDGRLKAATCSKNDSECGQGVWIDGDSEMNIPGPAPIIHWRACQINGPVLRSLTYIGIGLSRT